MPLLPPPYFLVNDMAAKWHNGSVSLTARERGGCVPFIFFSLVSVLFSSSFMEFVFETGNYTVLRIYM